MKKIEGFVYNLVKKVPFLKSILRNVYQAINVLIFRPKKINLSYKYTVLENSFFGFHDKTPFSIDNSKLLSHRLSDQSKRKLPNKKEYVSVGYYQGTNYEEFKEIDQTLAWNYQQGSMLQWLSKSEIIYNVFKMDTNKHQAIIYDIERNIKRDIELPIAAISPNGRFGISYSFERLRRGMKGYGYANGIDQDHEEEIPKHGLKLVNFSDNSISEILNVKDIVKEKKGFHFFTHAQVSPNSDKVLIFYRRKISGLRLFTEMYSINLNTKEVYRFPTNGMVSHVYWKNNEEVVGYANTELGDGFYVFNIKQNSYKRINTTTKNMDGHPNVSKDNEYMLYDTYPNDKRIQSLYLYKFKSSNSILIGAIYSPFKFKNEYRCDLHPRFSLDSSLISIDSAFSGKRSTIVIYIK